MKTAASSIAQSPGLWQPTLGAVVSNQGVVFRVWAPTARKVELVMERPRREPLPMTRDKQGYFSLQVPHAGAGDLYRYRVDDQGPYPDPVSRYQPEGIHGPSMVVDARGFDWSDQEWKGLSIEDLVLYELHIGTFTREGTFAAAVDRLRDLKDLGITAVELMPVADFPGRWNWGYDGVALFAPARCYGRPEDLRRLVDEAHRIGLGVFMDVVYNHLGPDGNYTGVYSDAYFTSRHHSPWGAGVNLDDAGSSEVRRFFIENALHWVTEYHIDGLRLDATHAMVDESPRHFLEELTDALKKACKAWPTLVIAEDHRNLDHMVAPRTQEGWGLDGVWADDFHHQMRRLLNGDHEGYFEDFTGTAKDLAETLQRGWFFTGQASKHLAGLRGTNPDHLPYGSFVICLQKHDQIGNRAKGDRLHHAIEPAAYLAASAVLLSAPETPLLFMGQEWAATSPFLYFTDHEPELGRKVTEGRRQEFRGFSAFNDPAARAQIPDPQAKSSFDASRLRWEERGKAPHKGVLAFYKAMLALRKSEPALRNLDRDAFHALALDAESLGIFRMGSDGSVLLMAARLKGAGTLRWTPEWTTRLGSYRWETLLHTEESHYMAEPQSLTISLAGAAPQAEFPRAGAILWRGRAKGGHDGH